MTIGTATSAIVTAAPTRHRSARDRLSLAGFMPAGYKPATGAQYGFSGGAINYPRFLEDWSGVSCTYFGSMVELFQSKTFTGEWDTGVIYRPPDRRFNFDTNFNSKPPPCSLSVSSWSRGTWAKF